MTYRSHLPRLPGVTRQGAGLRALRRCFQGAAHQRCRVHVTRNLLAHVPKAQSDYVAAAFRTIFAQATPTEVDAAWEKTRDEFAARFPKLGPLMDEAKAEVLAFTAFPRAHWTKIWRPTRWSGSTRRSSAAPASWGSSPTPPP